MPIDSTHPKYADMLPKWQKIDDITRQRNLSRYLVTLNPLDKSAENIERNKAYRERAVFYALAGQTVAGMVGTMFRKWPTLNVPDAIGYLAENADGAGVSIYQQSQGLSDDIVRKSRGALVVSFPPTDGQVSRQDVLSGKYVATIQRLDSNQVINWQVSTEGSRTFLSLVVIKEDRETTTDGYDVETVEAIRELYLEDGTYKERHWIKGREGWVVERELMPTQSDGSPWREIPFIFVGSENNDPTPDDPPNMLAMCELNIGHYRNSADYEDSIWYAGQAQPWASGLRIDDLEDMKAHGVYWGSRSLFGVPAGEQVGIAQAEPNLAVRQAMLDKVEQMIGIGARMVQAGSAAKTATQIAGERETQHSVLSLIASNVSEAYTQCLQWVGMYMGVDDDEMAYTIAHDFVDPEATPQELQQIIAGFMAGAVPLADYVKYMQERGMFDQEKTVEEYAEELRNNPSLPVGTVE